MASRIELKELAIRGVRQPCQGMPIGSIVGGESPRDRIPVKPGLSVDILGDIDVIVVIDEWVLDRRVVKNDGGDYQDKAENKRSLLRSCEPGSSEPGSSEPGSSEAARSRLRQSPLLRFLARMFGFQASRSHSSPVFDEYIRPEVCRACGCPMEPNRPRFCFAGTQEGLGTFPQPRRV